MNSPLRIPSFRSSVRNGCQPCWCLLLSLEGERSMTESPIHTPKCVELGKAERTGCPQFNQGSING